MWRLKGLHTGDIGVYRGICGIHRGYVGVYRVIKGLGIGFIRLKALKSLGFIEN